MQTRWQGWFGPARTAAAVLILVGLPVVAMAGDSRASLSPQALSAVDQWLGADLPASGGQPHAVPSLTGVSPSVALIERRAERPLTDVSSMQGSSTGLGRMALTAVPLPLASSMAAALFVVLGVIAVVRRSSGNSSF